MTRRRGLVIGAGYFSDFHLDAWQRLPDAEIVCVCDLDNERVQAAAEKYNIPNVSTDPAAALARDDLDFVDIVTPPASHLELVERALSRNLPVICQKPLAPDFATARKLIDRARLATVPFMVHENFRFQPWYREIRKLLEAGTIGDRLHTITMRSRMGDGWGADAYLGRQPYFRDMPRFLIHETGVHFVDTFRFLAGEITRCHATLRRLNDGIAGEDAGVLTLEFASGAIGIWDANRYNESLSSDFRYTFGELLVEGCEGSIWLDSDGRLTVKRLGREPEQHAYSPAREGFGGDCVYATQQHFLDVLAGRIECETSADAYLRTLQVVEAVYASAAESAPVALTGRGAKHRRFVDLSRPVENGVPGVDIQPCRSLLTDGWNATTLSLYSHTGTHMDAPRHFLADGKTLDQLDLSVCCGPARIVNLAPAAPRQRFTPADITNRIGDVRCGDRLLLRTDWYQRFGTDEFRNALPGLSLELAEWLVAQQIALIGVEPPSVADVTDRNELTAVHQTLFRGNVVILEGLMHLDQLTSDCVELFALPLRITGGDGCPVRAVAVELTESPE